MMRMGRGMSGGYYVFRLFPCFLSFFSSLILGFAGCAWVGICSVVCLSACLHASSSPLVLFFIVFFFMPWFLFSRLVYLLFFGVVIFRLFFSFLFFSFLFFFFFFFFFFVMHPASSIATSLTSLPLSLSLLSLLLDQPILIFIHPSIHLPDLSTIPTSMPRL
ncbi:hypothetical protein EX30DRAFT_161394 [Ascodesmis nigricans]|uniref:Uncharacterized protein n=1 Tax=Ascodesmis nigricans TaxID=341454 RepID=A0A4S2MMC8_9PEZI|nr:hypothetical protein EX30DRAFT_161394 [Ascodesmis nigricans]